ncbi:hypothetical protein [Methylobacterium nigriterrae]|uniref:hypothetical protein n=1 Tax=Methylobacterium nigriterrae TaxID=3127512 RepID=UPI003013FEE0
MTPRLSAAVLGLAVALALPALPASAQGSKAQGRPSLEATAQTFSARMNRLDSLMGATPRASLLSREATEVPVRRTRIRDANAER